MPANSIPRPTIQSLDRPKFVRMAVLAPSGFGKTVFCGTAPKALFLTTDPEGTASAAAFGSTAKEIVIDDQDDLWNAYLWLKNGGIDELGIENLIIDNGSQAQRNAMDRALQAAYDRNPEKANRYVPSQHEYLIEQNYMVDCVKKFNQLPINVFWTFHRRLQEDADGEQYYSAVIRGKTDEIAQTCLGYMNVVGMGDVVTFVPAGQQDPVTRRRMYFQHTGKQRGKDRYVRLGKFKDDLTIPALLELLYPQGQHGPAVSITRGVALPANRPRPVKRV